MNILIIGGGISGISAAKVALKEGHSVTILESAAEPGGLMARIANCRVGFKTFFDEIAGNPRLVVVKDTKIVSVDKSNSQFYLTLKDGQSLTADKIVIATGLSPYDPIEYKGKRVLASLEYDAIIDQRNGELPSDFNKIAFVLCVGSRSKEYPLCSSVCCSYSLREIKWTLQRAKPEIKVFYNDLRFFGQEFFMEKLYRDAGVTFVRANSRYFEEDETGVSVRYFVNGELQEERFNYVVLATGLRPNPQLLALSKSFGFSLNEFGFVKESEPLTTDVKGVYVSGGALEPMNIKDSILTGFGAGLLAIKNDGFSNIAIKNDARLYVEPEPEMDSVNGSFDSCLFYLGTEDAVARVFYEYISSKFISLARELKKAGKTVYVLTKNMVMPSYAELVYEKARREGIVFIHLEEDETVSFSDKQACISGPKKESFIDTGKIIRFDDYIELLKDREFLSLYRSEPQLRWSPTKWGRKKFHVGFIRHPRDPRWEARELLGALGEILLDAEEERVLPEVNEERCSGCGSCKDACPQSAIEIKIIDKQISVFGPIDSSGTPIAHVKDDTCVSCGLCASVCPSDVISFPAALLSGGVASGK
ncbi:MAG: FAD-dependent oxidoreductase [Proteobacteria bacterium]|nr:FAD-dependent oxidoreductase [Pseudomonadota bacterium]